MQASLSQRSILTMHVEDLVWGTQVHRFHIDFVYLQHALRTDTWSKTEYARWDIHVVRNLCKKTSILFFKITISQYSHCIRAIEKDVCMNGDSLMHENPKWRPELREWR